MDGFSNGYKTSSFTASCVTVAKNENSIERDYEFTSKCHLNDISSPSELGKIAAERILNSSEPMASLRKKIYYYKDTKIPTLVFYHPAYLLRSPGEKKKVWEDILFMRENINVS